LVLLFVLVGIGLGEPSDGAIEDLVRSQVGGDGDWVTRPGVRPG
jgi:hypothetical protein